MIDSFRKRKKKILLVSNMYPSKDNIGYGVFVKDIYESFDEENFVKEKCVISSKRGSGIIKKFFVYFIFKISMFFSIVFNRYDYIYCHYVSHVLFLPVLLKIIGFKYKLVAHVHGSDVHDKPSIVFKLLNYCDVVIVPSKCYFNLLSRKIKNPSKIVISPSGGVLNYFFSSPRLINNKEIGYVGRLEFVKRPERYKALAEYSLTNGFNFFFNVTGSGKLSKIFSDVTQNLKLNNSVSREELPAVFKKISFLIVTSDRESLCLVALEAMSNGVVVIANDCGGVSDYIVNGFNGFIVDMNQNDWYKGVCDIMNLDDFNYRKLSNAAYKTSLNYRNSSITEKLINNVFF